MNHIAGELSYRGMLAAGTRMVLTTQDGETRSGNELVARVASAAGELTALGLGRKRIGLWFWNGASAVEAFLAVEWIGAVRVALDPNLPTQEAQAFFSAAQVDAVIADPEHAEMLGGSGVLVHSAAWPLSGAALLPRVEVCDEPCIYYPRQIHQGRLVGVTITFCNWIAALQINMSLYERGRYGPPVRGDDQLLTAQQIVHGTGMLGTFPFLCMGLHQVMMRRFDVAEVAHAIQTHEISSTVLVSEMVKRLTEPNTVDAGQFRTLRRVLYGGAPLKAAENQRAKKVLGPVLVQVYGRMEAGWPLSVLAPGEDVLDGKQEGDEQSSCGRAVEGMEMRITGQLAGEGVGELIVKSNMSSPEFTDSEGWCRTGDLMRRNGAGYLFHLRRVDRQINVAGYHIYPDEIEELIVGMQGVQRALVLGEEDPKRGTTLVAYVVPVPTFQQPLNWQSALRDSLVARLARFKVPRAIMVVDESTFQHKVSSTPSHQS